MNATPPPLEPKLPQAEWPLWQRVGFRYVCLHWLLYALPRPFFDLLGVIGWYLAKVEEFADRQGWRGLDLTSWLEEPSAWGATLEEWWQASTTWVSETAADWSDGAWSFEVIHQLTGSGDTMHDWVRQVVEQARVASQPLAASLVLALKETFPHTLNDVGRLHDGTEVWLLKKAILAALEKVQSS